MYEGMTRIHSAAPVPVPMRVRLREGGEAVVELVAGGTGVLPPVLLIVKAPVQLMRSRTQTRVVRVVGVGRGGKATIVIVAAATAAVHVIDINVRPLQRCHRCKQLYIRRARGGRR